MHPQYWPGHVIRYDQGAIVLSFIGPASIGDLNREIKGALVIEEGLHYLWSDFHFHGPALVEGDSKNAIAWASGATPMLWSLFYILKDAKSLSKDTNTTNSKRVKWPSGLLS